MKKSALKIDLDELENLEEAQETGPSIEAPKVELVKPVLTMYLGDLIKSVKHSSQPKGFGHPVLYEHREFIAQAMLYEPFRNAPIKLIDPTDAFMRLGSGIEALVAGYRRPIAGMKKGKQIRGPLADKGPEMVGILIRYIPDIAVATCAPDFATEVIGCYLKFKGGQ